MEESYVGEGEYDEYMFALGLCHTSSLAELLSGDAPVPSDGREHVTPQRVKELLNFAGLGDEDASLRFSLDGKRAGSVARFINSSDQPNLAIQTIVPPGQRDPRVLKIGLFALETIPALTELTYDYGCEYRENRLGTDYKERLARGSR